MYAYLTEIAFWGLVIFLCLGACYALLKLSAWLTGLMTERLEGALLDQEEQSASGCQHYGRLPSHLYLTR